jgi:hypothetical protein
MRTNQLVAAATIVLFSTVAASAQTTTAASDSVKANTTAASSEKMQTLFSGSKKNIKYLGFSVGSAIQYSSLAGASTPIAGTSWMLHINKKWGIGAAGYATVDRNFAPKAINTKFECNVWRYDARIYT